MKWHEENETKFENEQANYLVVLLKFVVSKVTIPSLEGSIRNANS